MTDLTKDWKDGKLPDGWYWVKGSRTKENKELKEKIKELKK